MKIIFSFLVSLLVKQFSLWLFFCLLLKTGVYLENVHTFCVVLLKSALFLTFVCLNLISLLPRNGTVDLVLFQEALFYDWNIFGKIDHVHHQGSCWLKFKLSHFVQSVVLCPTWTQHRIMQNPFFPQSDRQKFYCHGMGTELIKVNKAMREMSSKTTSTQSHKNSVVSRDLRPECIPAMGSMFSRPLGERPVSVFAEEPKCMLPRRVRGPPPRPGWGMRRTWRKPGGSS